MYNLCKQRIVHSSKSLVLEKLQNEEDPEENTIKQQLPIVTSTSLRCLHFYYKQ